ncbi:MAG: class I SAM-dependent methyltransferase [Gammaproteobacteria bacterium]
MNENQKEKSTFGFREVDSDKKRDLVDGVFNAVSDNYDLMNDFLSLGIHRLWKRVAIEIAEIRPNHRVLDLAGGTGDLIKLMSPKINKEGLLVLSDINENMLFSGRDRLIDQGIHNFESVQLDAQNIPFQKDYFDLITIAFGLRNVTEKGLALDSIYKCLKPGGRVLILEFSKPENEIFREIYDLYSFEVIPKIGELIAGTEESYRYLAESIRMHPDQNELLELMEKSGFIDCSYSNLTNGIVAIHTGSKR